MTKLLYLSNLRLPTEKAYGIQIAEMCSAFADTGLEVLLTYPYRRNPHKDFFSYYGIKRNFKIKVIPTVDFYLSGSLDKISVAVKSFISALFLTFYGFFSDADFIYSRDEGPLYFLSFFKKKFKERQYSVPQSLTTYLSSLSTYTSTVNSNLSTLFSIKNTIVNSKMSIEEKTESLAKLKEGVSDLDLASQKLSLKQKENALLDVQEKLSDYYIRAPFNGTIVKVNVKKSDAASSGTAVATLVTRQKIAELSLNEIDAAKIKVDQKAMLSFDAVDGLNIAGKVAEVDAVGTVSQGVVTYNVKISFDTQDDRVKSGMSVSAAIIIDSKQDVLIVPNSAIKSGNNISYAEMLDKTFSANQGSQGVASDNLPKQQIVETGITDDTNIEIISGLKEGDQIIIKTINSSTSSSSSQQTPSILGAIGGNNKR